jgi:hypothetical protein
MKLPLKITERKLQQKNVPWAFTNAQMILSKIVI